MAGTATPEDEEAGFDGAGVARTDWTAAEEVEKEVEVESADMFAMASAADDWRGLAEGLFGTIKGRNRDRVRRSK